jgi:NADH-quinone oxidoreductase subunit G
MCVVKIGTPKVDRATGKPELDANGKPVIAMMPRLQTACTTPVSEGMVVVTADEEVKHAQNGVLEGLLTSHPLDCPVCDKGGECPLQNLTMGWGPGKTRFDYNDKVHFEKPIPLGDLIYLDRERCILCARCVRFQDEIAGDPVLGFDNRGRAWQIISMSDPTFDSKFSGNTTDICPVGALTSADFRFKARVWELQADSNRVQSLPGRLQYDLRYALERDQTGDAARERRRQRDLDLRPGPFRPPFRRKPPAPDHAADSQKRRLAASHLGRGDRAGFAPA